MNPLNEIKIREHVDGTWDFYIYAGENGEQLCHSNQHYENQTFCAEMASRVTSGAINTHFTYIEKRDAL